MAIAAPLGTALASVRDGERIKVERILSASLRQECAAVGFGEGDTLFCLRAGRGYLLLDNSCGRVMSVDRDLARYVRVTRSSGGECTAHVAPA